MKSQVVLLSGKQGSGKSTIQNLLLRKAGIAGFDWAVARNFADPIYDLHDTILTKIRDVYRVARDTRKDGRLLQLLGTDWGRATLGEDVWIRIMQDQIASEMPGALIVIGDCRFENEFDAFPEALRVRLTAAESSRKARAQSWRENTNHSSETDLDRYAHNKMFDLCVQTDGLVPPDGVVDLILAQLQKNCWLEKRPFAPENQTKNSEMRRMEK